MRLWQLILIRLGLGVLLRWTHPQRRESESERKSRLRREYIAHLARGGVEMTTRELAELVREMRKVQRDRDRRRNPSLVSWAKDMEAQVDGVVQLILSDQPTLFGGREGA